MSTEGMKERMGQLEKLLSVMEELRNPRSPRGMFMTVLRFLQARPSMLLYKEQECFTYFYIAFCIVLHCLFF